MDTPASITSSHITNKRAVLNRLRRVEGQVRGLERMVSEDAYCIDILTQVAAATRALEGVARSLLDEHMQRCLAAAAATDGADAQRRVSEATAAIARLVRS